MPALPSIESLIIVAAVAIIAITFHEAAHGYVAWKLGDDTARQQGRVSFNPLRHIDPFGTVVLPLLLFVTAGWILGWAKPVPVNPSRLNSPRRDMIFVAAAGPGINLLLALASAFLLSVYVALGGSGDFVPRLLISSVSFNVLIGVFNLIPIPPFDGGRIAVGVLPGSLAYRLQRVEPYGMWLVIGVLVLVPLVTRKLGNEIDLYAMVLQPIVEGIVRACFGLFGLGGAA